MNDRDQRQAVAAAALAAGLITLGGFVAPAPAGIGADEAVDPAISASGRYVAFVTGFDLGGPVHPTSTTQVYIHDNKTSRTRLVSRRSKGKGGRGHNGEAFDVDISASGRYVAFDSTATNLGNPSGDRSIYVYDRKRKRLQLVSRQSKGKGGAAAAGAGSGDQLSRNVEISASGRYVAFNTQADNLGGPIDTDETNVYLYDRKRKRTELISRQSKANGGAGGTGDSYGPVMSNSGRYVAFHTSAANLGGPTQPGFTYVYVYDRKRKRIQLVSKQSKSDGGGGANATARAPAISASGRIVAFHTSATNLGGPIASVVNVYAYDRKRKRVQLVSRKSKGGAGGDDTSSFADISASGRYVSFHSSADNLGGPIDTDFGNGYVFDRKSKRVRLVSRQSANKGGAGANNWSNGLVISASGRFAAFSSSADNLGGGNKRLGGNDIYRYDRNKRKLRLVSRK